MNKDDSNITEYTIELYNQLKSSRGNLEALWQEIAHYVRPSKTMQNPKDIYDSTGILAAEYLISGLWSLINNSSANWFNIKYDGNINNETKEYLHNVNKLMKQSLNDAYSGFYYKSHEFYADLVTFGTSIFYVNEDLANKKVMFTTCNLSETYIHKTYSSVDTVIKVITLTAKQSIDLFGEKRLNENIIKAFIERSSETFTFLHLTIPSKYFNDEITAKKQMEYSSFYIDLKHQTLVSKSGYHEFPYMVSRFSTNANQSYGHSPAMSALPDIKMLNAMSKTMLIAAQKEVDPPLLAPNEGSIQGIKSTPGGIIYGAIDALTGNQLLKPLSTNSNLNNSYELQEQRRKSVREAFYNSLLMFTYSNNATATEVLSVNEQKLRILGSSIARLQTEFLYPLIKRQYYIMLRLGLLPKLPKSFDVNNIDVEFSGTWNRYQKMIDSSSLYNIATLVSSVQGFDSSVSNIVDWKEIVKLVATSNGIPDSLFNNIYKANNSGENNA